MNDGFSETPREQMEARLTALLHGELSPEEAAALREEIAQDAELAQLHERLKQTIGLVAEVAANPVEQAAAQQTPLRLSAERREKLLQHFKTVAPKEFAASVHRESRWFVPMSLAAALVALLGTVALLPGFARRLERSKETSFVAVAAAENGALEFGVNKKDFGAAVIDNFQSQRESIEKPLAALGDSLGIIPSKNAGVVSSLKSDFSTTAAPPDGEVRIKTIRDMDVERYGLMRPGMSSLGKDSKVTEEALRESNRSSIVLPPIEAEAEVGQPRNQAWAADIGARTLAKAAKPGTESKSGARPAESTQRIEELQVAQETPQSKAKREWGELRAGHATRSATGASRPPLAPNNGPVQIVDVAQAESPRDSSLWGRIGGALSGKVERSARISVGKDATDMAPLVTRAQPQVGFDPYFVTTEFEKVKSKQVLYKVIEKLNLNEAWAEKHGKGEKLNNAEAFQALLGRVDVRQVPNSSELDIRVKSDQPEEAAQIANTIAEVYRDLRAERSKQAADDSARVLKEQLAEQEKKDAQAHTELDRLRGESNREEADTAVRKPVAGAPVPQPEVQTRENAFSTFSLHVSDVSFKLALASLEKGVMPEPATVRSEEFINAFDYGDSEPPPDVPVAFAWERARYPFAHNRDLLRFSIKTAAQGRQPGQPLNLVLLLDNSGSMERADRVQILREALRVLATQLKPEDKLSVIAFARTARLWVDGAPGNQAAQVAERVSQLAPQGGTNLEDALNLAYATALRHYVSGGNRVVVLTDGAANLGDVNPDTLKRKVENHRKQGIALDCFGIGWEGFNDDLLEVLSRNGDGRYGFINTPAEAATGFVAQLAGSLRVAASDVKAQVEFNPKRVTACRQIGYAKHQLTKEQFRDNTVDAAEIGAAESGNALYVVEVNPQGDGPLAVVRVRYKKPNTTEYREHEWPVPYSGNAVALEQAGPAMRLAATASAFSEWLISSPYAGEVTTDRLLAQLNGVPEVYGADARPKKLEWMIRQAKSMAGR